MSTLNDAHFMIVFGGAFDPPHIGHLQCAQWALDAFPSAQVLVVPTRFPHKDRKKASDSLFAFDVRVKLCEQAFAELRASSRVVVSAIEDELPPPCYTVDLLAALRAQNPTPSYFFMLGQDQFELFHHWHDPKGILEQAGLLVVPRSGASGELDVTMRTLAKQLELECIQTGSRCFALPQVQSQVVCLENVPKRISSSELRAAIRNGQDIPQNVIPESVWKILSRQA